MEEEEKIPQFVTVKTYAELSGMGPHAIYARIRKSENGFYKEGDEGYLEQTTLAEAEGVFIDTEIFPIVKMKKGRKKKQS